MMGKNDFSGPINLGNPTEISILKLAEEIIELTGSKSKIINKRLPVDDPKQRCPDINKAIKELQWQPKFGRKEGLQKTINYFESLLKGEKEGG